MQKLKCKNLQLEDFKQYINKHCSGTRAGVPEPSLRAGYPREVVDRRPTAQMGWKVPTAPRGN